MATTRINEFCCQSSEILGVLPLLERNARKHPTCLAWDDIANGEQLTHIDYYRNALWAIYKLKSLGCKEGQSVAFILSHSCYFIAILTACIELGLTLVPIEDDRNEIKNVVHSIHPRILLYSQEVQITKYTIPAKIITMCVDEFMVGNAQIDITKENINPSSDLKELPALLIKTSGTTGQSKFVELCEKNLAWNAYCLQQRFQCSPSDRFMCTLPWSHMNAIMITGCFVLNVGATTVWNNITKVTDPISSIVDAKVNIVSLTPTLIAFLLKRQKDGQSLGHIKFALCGAAPFGSDLWSQAEDKLQCKIYQGYGLSETTCWITSSLSGKEEDFSNVGKLLVGELQIDTSDNLQIITHNTPLDDETIELGEIQYKGPILMCGYRSFDGKRALKLTKEGFFNTGDVGYIDSHNRLHVIGRSKEIIIRSGINVVPESIDSIVREHPGISESKTIGIADELLGEQIITAYIPKPETNVSDLELRRFVSDKLPRLFIPNKFVRIASLPKNRVGKIAILELRKILSGETAQLAFDTINTWKFKREQPEHIDEIIRSFQHKVQLSLPIEFCCYWGIGSKTQHSKADIHALERLNDMLQEITKATQIPTKLFIIMTDVHALINGKPISRIDSYLNDIEILANSFGFSCIRSSQIWTQHGLNLDKIRLVASQKTIDEIRAENHISQDTLERLKNSASKHVEADDRDFGLKCYILACLAERDVFAEIYKDMVFLTYNDEDMGFLTPPLPTFAVCSFQKGITVKPWFYDD